MFPNQQKNTQWAAPACSSVCKMRTSVENSSPRLRALPHSLGLPEASPGLGLWASPVQPPNLASWSAAGREGWEGVPTGKTLAESWPPKGRASEKVSLELQVGLCTSDLRRWAGALTTGQAASPAASPLTASDRLLAGAMGTCVPVWPSPAHLSASASGPWLH